MKKSLIDSFNKQDKRYAIWGFEEILQIKNSGVYLNNQLMFLPHLHLRLNMERKERNSQFIYKISIKLIYVIQIH